MPGLAAPAGSVGSVIGACMLPCTGGTGGVVLFKVHGPASMSVLTLASVHLPAAPRWRAGTAGLLHQAGLLALAASHGAGLLAWQLAGAAASCSFSSQAPAPICWCGVVGAVLHGDACPGPAPCPQHPSPSASLTGNSGRILLPLHPASVRLNVGSHQARVYPSSMGLAGTRSRPSWPHPAHLSGRWR